MRASCLVIAIAAVAGSAPRASAQSVSVQAQSLFDDGRRLLAAGTFPEACAAFEASQKLEPKVTTLLNLADCREQNHQLASAWGTFTEAKSAANLAKNANLARVAANHASKLAPRLSKLTIAVPDDHLVPNLEVSRDGAPVISAAWNHALPIDGGSYVIRARAPGRAAWSITQEIKVEGDAVTVTIPLLDLPGVVVARPLAPAPAQAADPGGSPVQVTATTEPASRLPVVPLALGGGALALGGGALAFHLSGNHLYDQASATKADQAKRDSLEHSANTRRYVAEAFAGAAIGCAGAAVYLYVRDRGRDRTETTAMTPIATPQFAGLAAVGRW